ncbi:tyrosine-type recombinase/integrase [Tsukamurella sp. NPDC003166]|uniref:tyrosine-type recombinase/integrase n=1 Tax=Tsukamurella sp. NPDC003166 TaxID=3154444 RepID=UPI0033A92F5C
MTPTFQHSESPDYPGRFRHLSAHWVGTLVSRALTDGSTMHQLRHLCATEIHNQTHDVRLVQTILGHASLATTQRYLAVDETKVREALTSRAKSWGTEAGRAQVEQPVP